MNFAEALKHIVEAELSEIPKLKQQEQPPISNDNTESDNKDLESKKDNENIKVDDKVDKVKDKEDEKENTSSNYGEKDYEAMRNKLIDKFNEENENESNIILKPYDIGVSKRNFIVILNIDEPYFDERKYESGEIELKLNEIFYNDLKSICSEVGIKRITWKKNADIKYGEISLV